MHRWSFTAGKWSADLISGVQLSSLCSSCCLCAACYSEPIPSSEETLRDDLWKARGLSPVPSRLVCGDCSFIPPLLQFLCLLLCLSDLWFVSMRRPRRPQVCFKNKRGGGFTQAVQVTQTWMHSSHTFTHLQCFLWPKQLVFVVKRLIRKKTPLCWRSQALTKGQQQLNSDKSVCFSLQTLFSISAFHQKASVPWLWLILQCSQIARHKRRQPFFNSNVWNAFHVDYVKRTKLLAKKLKFKRRFACLCHSSEVRFPVSKVCLCLAIDALKCLMSK